MLTDFVEDVKNLPPVHWVTHLGLWNHAPFTWIGNLFGAIFDQSALGWVGNHFAWLTIMAMVLIPMSLEFMFWAWSWVRGRQIGYDSEKATKWTSGPRKGQLKRKPINLRKARARRYAWPRVGLPLYLTALAMYTWYLLWPGSTSALFLALLWFAFAPVRRTMFIATARKAYLGNNPGDKLDTTLFEDVYNYFYTGVARPAHKRADIEPPFEDTGALYRFLNWGHRTFGVHGAFWRLWRFWNFLRFWGVLVEAVISFFWPISVVVAPFFYMYGVEDYEDWMNPWWRRYRKSYYNGGVVKGKVVKTEPASSTDPLTPRVDGPDNRPYGGYRNTAY